MSGACSKVVFGAAIMFLSNGLVASSLDIPPCDKPLGYELADQPISVQHFECEADGVCGVVLKAPSILDERKFLSFHLLFSNARQGSIQLAHQTDEQGENVYTSFELPRPYFRTISVRAIYEVRSRCTLQSVWIPPELPRPESQ